MSKKIKILLAICVSALSLTSCEKETFDAVAQPAEASKKETNFTGSSFITNPKNLNIVYFVPNDNPPVEGYEERLSELLIYFQNYIRGEMERNGYPNKTFGLPYDSLTGRVKIVVVPGKQGRASYPYSGGNRQVEPEVRAYMQQHPEEFSSDFHNLIILPAQPNSSGNVPFYGTGRWAYALDNPFIKVSEIPITKSSYIGGMLHELLHGLGLDHESPKPSDRDRLGNTLMGTGNSTFGKKPTYVSECWCAILNQNEIFQSSPRADNYTPLEANILLKKKTFNAVTKNIELEGDVSANKGIGDVTVEIRRVGAGGGEYILPWRSQLNGSHFKVEIPLEELPKSEAYYNFTIRAIAENGTTQAFSEVFHRTGDSMSFNEFVSLFEHGSYGGWKFELPVGEYTSADLSALGIPDNAISSIKVPLGMEITLYDGPNFNGKSLTFTTSSSFIRGLNDKVSSLKIVKIH